MKMEELKGEVGGGFSTNAFKNMVANGTVDIHGRLADKTKTGGWKASSFIIGQLRTLFIFSSLLFSLSATVYINV